MRTATRPWNRRLTLTAAGLAVFVALASGCSDDGVTDAADDPRTSGSEGSRSSGPGRQDGACGFLEADDIADVLDADIEGQPTGNVVDCTWVVEGGGSLNLSLLVFGSGDEARFTFRNIYGEPGQSPTDPNYGVLADDAEYLEIDGELSAYVPNDTGAELAVMGGRTVIRLTLQGADPEDAREPLSELIRQALDRVRAG